MWLVFFWAHPSPSLELLLDCEAFPVDRRRAGGEGPGHLLQSSLGACFSGTRLLRSRAGLAVTPGKDFRCCPLRWGYGQLVLALWSDCWVNLQVQMGTSYLSIHFVMATYCNQESCVLFSHCKHNSAIIRWRFPKRSFADPDFVRPRARSSNAVI